jgi:hypothetical protein
MKNREGSWAGSVPLNNGSGSGRPKSMRIRIPNTGKFAEIFVCFSVLGGRECFGRSFLLSSIFLDPIFVKLMGIFFSILDFQKDKQCIIWTQYHRGTTTSNSYFGIPSIFCWLIVTLFAGLLFTHRPHLLSSSWSPPADTASHAPVLPWTTATAGAGRVGNKKPTQKKTSKKTLKMDFLGFFGFF